MRGGRRGGLWSEEEIASSGTGSERAQGRERSRGDPSASQGLRLQGLPKGAWKPITPQYKGPADTSTITASRIPIMYRMEAPNALRNRRRMTVLR